MRQSNVCQALIKPRLSNGVSTQALAICWGPGALAAVLTATSAEVIYYAAIPIVMSLGVHAILRWAYKKDSRVFEIYLRYASLGGAYHPNSRERLPRGFERPHKVGRGVRL
jgi:type IV secretory pathway TrbD component